MNFRGMIVVSCLLSAGCASAPEIQNPELDLPIPSRWTAAETTEGEVPEKWWEAFNDPALNDAVRQAIEQLDSGGGGPPAGAEPAPGRLDVAEVHGQVEVVGGEVEPDRHLGVEAVGALELEAGHLAQR